MERKNFSSGEIIPVGLLSPRQIEVLSLLALGYSFEEIPPLLGLKRFKVQDFLRETLEVLEVPDQETACHLFQQALLAFPENGSFTMDDFQKKMWMVVDRHFDHQSETPKIEEGLSLKDDPRIKKLMTMLIRERKRNIAIRNGGVGPRVRLLLKDEKESRKIGEILVLTPAALNARMQELYREYGLPPETPERREKLIEILKKETKKIEL